MSLKEYRRKRHFNATPEPEGKPGPARHEGGLAYVIQKHAASHLHYDFRLELDGTLKSWAVPKGPSLDPESKSLAIQVEDHPVAYGSFEGIIPAGEYGGGTVMVWDRGTWTPDADTDPRRAYHQGKLKFELHGEKLKGRWMLLRVGNRPGKPQWLLRKLEDKAAKPGATYDIREARPKSVASGRTMEQIAAAADATWHSGRSNFSNGSYNGTLPKPARAATPKAPPSRKKPRASRARSGAAAPSEAAGAVEAPMPDEVEVQLATLVDAAPEGERWVHELKFDGYRILAHVENGAARLISRNGKDWTDRFSVVADAAGALPVATAIVDGEVVALNRAGTSDFQALQQAMKSPAARGKLVYYVFDLIYLNGFDLRPCPLLERQRLLSTLVPSHEGDGAPGLVRFSESIQGRGDAVFKNACRLAMEGIVSKRADAPYEGGRSHTWVKHKCTHRQEIVIGGFTEPRGGRSSFGALLMGYYGGDEFHFAGKVGTGFDDQTLDNLLRKLRPLEVKQPVFVDPPRGYEARGAHWVKPSLVAEIEFTEWTDEGKLRHPVFIGLREDKSALEVVRERPRPLAAVTAGARPALRPRSAAKAARSKTSSRKPLSRKPSDDQPGTVLGVPLTHPDRLLFLKEKISKQQLAEYFTAVAHRMLPLLAGRPIMLLRCTGGAGGRAPCFFQKHIDEDSPPGLHPFPIVESEGAKNYLVLDEPRGLVSLAQRSVLEIHSWGSTEKAIEKPDRVVFDLDPGPGVEWGRLVEAALLIRKHLKTLGLESFVKTSGGKGIHVIAPCTPGPGWEQVKAFTHDLAQAMATQQPDRYIAVMTKSKRPGRVFIDYLRNGRGSTTVAAFSPRARAGAHVSVPITWDELESASELPTFTLDQAAALVASRTPDPWRRYLSVRQKLPIAKR